MEGTPAGDHETRYSESDDPIPTAGYQSLPDNRMRFAFDVSRDEPGQPVVCVVRVREINGTETGRREVLVPAGASPQRVETVITGSAEPVTADVFGCSYQVPEYLSTEERPTE